MAALTGMQIYKNLPKTNCKKCGYPTCMAFAMQVAAKQKALTDCPFITEDAKAALSDASSPPMRLVKIGPDGKQFVFGQETVMYRHEEKFHHPAGIAVRIPASLSDDAAAQKAETAGRRVFERVGAKLKVELCAVEVDGCANPAARAQLVSAKSGLPVILMGAKVDALKAAAEAIKATRPLICKATVATIDALSDVAKAIGAPLAISAESLDEAADLTQKARAKGVEDLVLAFSGPNVGDTLRKLTIARRAALKKNCRPLGYPTIVEFNANTPPEETLLAATFVAKYAGIVVIDGLEPWELLPIMAVVQSVYTDPQVPNAVESKLYQIGSPNENSPVFFTTNFSLTYFSVAGEVERSKIPAYICVVNTEGLGVLNSYAGDKISPEKVIKTLIEQKVAEKVKHRKLIIPGLLPIFKGEIEDASEWKEVIIGPESASKIPAFLNSIWK